MQGREETTTNVDCSPTERERGNIQGRLILTFEYCIVNEGFIARDVVDNEDSNVFENVFSSKRLPVKKNYVLSNLIGKNRISGRFGILAIHYKVARKPNGKNWRKFPSLFQTLILFA